MGCIPEVAFGSGEAEPGHMCLVMSDENAVPTPNTGGDRIFVVSLCVSALRLSLRIRRLSMRQSGRCPNTARLAGLS